MLDIGGPVIGIGAEPPHSCILAFGLLKAEVSC